MPSDRFVINIRSRPLPPRAATPDALWRESIAETMATYTPRATGVHTRHAAPMTSAVRAGWICTALGLATAWFFPFAQGFFSLGMIMAVVAMATHQVRAGLLLLAGAFGSSALCMVVFLSGVLALLGGMFAVGSHQAMRQQTEFQVEPPRFVVPSAPPRIHTPAYALSGVVDNTPGYRVTASHPLRLEDIRLMLRTGLGDAEIMAAVADRQLVEPVGPVEAAGLRALGAGSTLLGHLRASRLYADPTPNVATTVAVCAALPPAPLPVSASTPVDYAARDRRIESLKQQIDTLDDRMRTVRTNPRDYRYLGNYAGSGNGGVSQPALQKYLDQLDQQRNALRREKWQLEGR